MTTTISGESELDLLERIVTEAKDKTEPKIPTITDVLKVYDDFISNPTPFFLLISPSRPKDHHLWLLYCTKYLQKGPSCSPPNQSRRSLD